MLKPFFYLPLVKRTIYAVYILRNITYYARGHQLIATHILFVIFIIRVLHVVPVHPDSHPKHAPFCMSQILSLQLVGHCSSQLVPYTPEVLQPVRNILIFIALLMITCQKRIIKIRILSHQETSFVNNFEFCMFNLKFHLNFIFHVYLLWILQQKYSP